MFTLGIVAAVLGFVIYVFIYTKAKDLWNKSIGEVIILLILPVAIFLSVGIASDIYGGINDVSGPASFFILPYVHLGLAVIISIGLSSYDNFDFDISEINIAAPVKIVVEVIGFIASILGIVSFFNGR